jgi:G3E family GTPase
MPMAPAAASVGRASPGVRLLVIGGFLGAGKTTALLRLARGYHERGLRVGLITNDQAANLVDTGNLRVRGFRVEEVAGACFCCKFDDLARVAEKLRAEERPDVLLGEPVGSCTDLAATVVAPFRKLYGEHYSVAPYSVLVDPLRARQILLERGFGGFSPKVAYIFQKQLEEADVICVNKSDLLAPAQAEELRAAVAAEFPRARVLLTSGQSGAGYDEWLRHLAAPLPAGQNVAEVDYDTYAEGEAELGWLNLALELRAHSPFDADRLVRELVSALAAALAARGAEIAHLKIMLATARGAAVANSVGGGSGARLSQALGERPGAGRLVVNARVHLDPAALAMLARAVLAEELARHGIEHTEGEAAHFRPGRPVPIHRYSPEEARSE